MTDFALFDIYYEIIRSWLDILNSFYFTCITKQFVIT